MRCARTNGWRAAIGRQKVRRRSGADSGQPGRRQGWRRVSERCRMDSVWSARARNTSREISLLQPLARGYMVYLCLAGSATRKAATAMRRAPSRVAGKVSWLGGEEAENRLISFGTIVSASGTTRGWKATLSVRAEALARRNWTGYAMPWRFTPTGVGSGWRVNFASGGSGARPKAD